MSTQALYLKYRPRTFEEVVGQEPIMRTLRNALLQGRVRHAYLFTGPRGTGKTTTARLLAKAVNCLAPQADRPCNRCAICIAINDGRLLDLIEIDAASNRGIDEIRDIREKAGFRPNEGRFKVYVLDEAHMLTEPAFNALLKTLEEPPPHVIFILVTTDPHKIPATITSRCQRFDFRRIALQTAMDRLAKIAQDEGVAVDPPALEMIALQGTGAMRDAISLLDQLTSYGDEITLEQVRMVLGTVSNEAAGRLAACLAAADVAGGLDVIQRALVDGADPRQLGRGVVEYLRGLLLVQQGAGTRLLNVPTKQAVEMEALAAKMPPMRLLRAIHLFNDAVNEVKGGVQVIPQLPLEMAVVESILEPTLQPAAAAPTSSRAEPAQPAPVHSLQPQRRPDGQEAMAEHRVAKPLAPGIPPEPGSGVELEGQSTAAPPKTPAQTDRVQSMPTPGGPLTLEQVQDAWDRVLQVVRQRNPTTQGVLNTGCRPVEVNSSEIVVTFPFAFMREKFRDPLRMMEIQDALSEVLQTKCNVRLVLAADYTPLEASPAAPAAVAPNPAPEAEQAHSPARAASGEQVPEEISRWAAERGGQATVIQ